MARNDILSAIPSSTTVATHTIHNITSASLSRSSNVHGHFVDDVAEELDGGVINNPAPVLEIGFKPGKVSGDSNGQGLDKFIEGTKPGTVVMVFQGQGGASALDLTVTVTNWRVESFTPSDDNGRMAASASGRAFSADGSTKAYTHAFA